MTPVKEKAPTELQKARELVREMMKEKEDNNGNEDIPKLAEEANPEPQAMEMQSGSDAQLLELQQEGEETHTKEAQHEEGGRLPTEGRAPDGLPSSRAAAVMASPQESGETGATGCIKPGEEILVTENAAADALLQGLQETQPGMDKEQLHLETQAASVTAADISSTGGRERMATAAAKVSVKVKKVKNGEEDNSSDDEEELTLQHKDKEQLAVRRNRNQKWEPPEGMRRCGQKCTGCAAKCASLGEEDCSSCQMNRAKETSKNICLNRGPCLNLKEQRPQADISRNKNKIPKQRDVSCKSLPRSGPEAEKMKATTIKVGQQAVVSRVDLVKEVL